MRLMPYLDELHVKVEGKRYTLTRPFRYRVLDSKGKVSVPAGFKTDFASIPRVFRIFITGHDRTRKAAVIHDYLYQSGFGRRKTADKIFLQAMDESGVSAWKRYAMYQAVRIGGWASWGK